MLSDQPKYTLNLFHLPQENFENKIKEAVSQIRIRTKILTKLLINSREEQEMRLLLS
jgi:hypothetical protein